MVVAVVKIFCTRERARKLLSFDRPRALAETALHHKMARFVSWLITKPFIGTHSTSLDAVIGEAVLVHASARITLDSPSFDCRSAALGCWDSDISTHESYGLWVGGLQLVDFVGCSISGGGGGGGGS